jgi:hypothetical protein
MKLKEALNIIVELASDNMLPLEDCEGDIQLIKQANWQSEAMITVLDFIDSL